MPQDVPSPDSSTVDGVDTVQKKVEVLFLVQLSDKTGFVKVSQMKNTFFSLFVTEICRKGAFREAQEDQEANI